MGKIIAAWLKAFSAGADYVAAIIDLRTQIRECERLLREEGKEKERPILYRVK